MTAHLYDADRRWCGGGTCAPGISRAEWIDLAARHQLTIEPKYRATWYAIDGGELRLLPVVAQVALPVPA